MNILFFLTPKKNLDYVYRDNTVRQIIEKMQIHRFSVIPVLNEDGTYYSTISNGDILRFIYECNFDKEVAESKHFKDISLHRPYKALSIDAKIEEILEEATNQNFIPIVDDRNIFIGIVRRRDIIKYYIEMINKNEKSAK